MHLSTITSVFLLSMARKFKENPKVIKWTSILRDVNFFLTFVFLVFLIPLRADFDWLLTQPFPFVIYLIFVFAMRPDSLVDLLLNIAILFTMYFQLTSVFILLVFILNFKVFHFGYKRKKVVKQTDQNSLAWAKTEFQEATSYLNSTIECQLEIDMETSER